MDTSGVSEHNRVSLWYIWTKISVHFTDSMVVHKQRETNVG